MSRGPKAPIGMVVAPLLVLDGDQAVPIFGPNLELLDSPLFGLRLVRRVDEADGAAGVPLRRRISQVNSFVLRTLRMTPNIGPRLRRANSWRPAMSALGR